MIRELLVSSILVYNTNSTDDHYIHSTTYNENKSKNVARQQTSKEFQQLWESLQFNASVCKDNAVPFSMCNTRSIPMFLSTRSLGFVEWRITIALIITILNSLRRFLKLIRVHN
mgnify:FL=1